MEALGNVGATIVVLGVMIFFHEFGHFITAKAFGMRVFIFSFGFGHRLFGFKWGDTDCRVSLIPLGGYVKLEGEPGDHISEDVTTRGDAKDFTARPRWQRFLVYLAGPVMNGVLTITLLASALMVGVAVEGTFLETPVVGGTEPSSPAAKAPLVAGDEIVAIDGQPVKSWEDVLYAIAVRPDRAVSVRVLRAGKETDVVVTSISDKKTKGGYIGVAPLIRPRVDPTDDGAALAAGMKKGDTIVSIDGKDIATFADLQAAVGASNGRPLVLRVVREGGVQDLTVQPRTTPDGLRIGVAPARVFQKYGPLKAFSEGGKWAWRLTEQTFDVLKRLLTAELSPKTMMGPLGIAKASGDAARSGPMQLVLLTAMISLQIGIMNLFPLPPLDGGHLAILAGESIIRRDFSENAKIWVMNAGAALLFLLIGFVLYSDFTKTSIFTKLFP